MPTRWSRASRLGLGLVVLVGLATVAETQAQDQPPSPLPAPAPAALPLPDRTMIERLERLETELQRSRAERDDEVKTLKAQVDRLEGQLQTIQVTPAAPGSTESSLSGKSPAEPGGSSSSSGSGSGSGGDNYSGGAGDGPTSTSGGGGGGGGGQGSVGRGERTGSRSPAGFKLSAEYKYNFAGGYFNFADDNKEFVLNVQNMLVADGTFYDRQEAPTREQGFNIPYQRTYLYGNITKNFEYQLSEQSSFGSFNLLDMLVNIHYDDRLMFKFGRYLAPFEYQSYATFPMLVPTVAYSPLYQFAANRQVGAMAWGKVLKNTVQYQLGVFNGVPNSYFDFDKNKDFIGSLTITPFKNDDRQWLQGLGGGFSMQTGYENYLLNRVDSLTFISGAGSPLLNFEYITASGVPFFYYHDNVRAFGNQVRIAPHLFWYGRFSLLAEYVAMTRELADPTSRGRSTQRGFFVQGSYFLTGERNTGDGTGGFPTIIPNRPFNPSDGKYGPGAWELVAQYSGLNIGSGDIRRGFADPQWATRLDEIQLGVNWWPNKYIRLSFDWVGDYFNKSIPWPVNNNQAGTPATQVRSNPVDQFNIFWTRIAFFF